MAIPPCLRLAETVFVDARAESAKRLAADGWPQSRIADGLGVSQAMVSKYLRRPAADSPLAVTLAEEWVGELAGAAGPGSWCGTLDRHDDPAAGAALDDLLQAQRLIRDASPMDLVPQIGLGLARALDEAEDIIDVLSVPGRLVVAGDRIAAAAPPTFGASRHLAACLLAARRAWPHLQAIASISGHPAIRDRLDRLDATTLDLNEADGPDRLAMFEAAITATPPTGEPGPDFVLLHDAGGFGIEPCIYLLGPDATQLAHALLTATERK